MRHAETVTFGGSGLDRAAELRGSSETLAKLEKDPSTRCIVMWHGKPLIQKNRPAHLLRLPMDHPIFKDAAPHKIFLGREDSGALFASDISDWVPEGFDAKELGSFLDPTEQAHPACQPDEVFAELRRIMTWLSPRDAEVAATARAMFLWHESHGFCARCGVESRWTGGGWHRICDACGRHHFPRTDPVVIMLITHGNSVLVGRSPGWPEGMYSLLAGFVEPGETLEAAVRRETMEEAGIPVGPVRYLSSQPWPFPASLMVGCWGEATATEIRLDPNELEDARWITREHMAQIFAGEDSEILPARKGAIAHFLIENWLADSLS